MELQLSFAKVYLYYTGNNLKYRRYFCRILYLKKKKKQNKTSQKVCTNEYWSKSIETESFNI